MTTKIRVIKKIFCSIFFFFFLKTKYDVDEWNCGILLFLMSGQLMCTYIMRIVEKAPEVWMNKNNNEKNKIKYY